MSKKIFISHSSKDKEIADLLVDFFVKNGIDKSVIFYTSYIDTGVNTIISKEIKEALKSCMYYILILSNNYYESVFCLQECGAIWFAEKGMSVIKLPDIDIHNLKGFINSDYLYRQMNDVSQMVYVFEDIAKVLGVDIDNCVDLKSSARELVRKYNELISKRNYKKKKINEGNNSNTDYNLISKDAMFIAYYVYKNKHKSFNKDDLVNYMNIKEFRNIDIKNGIDIMKDYRYLDIDDNNTIKIKNDTFLYFCNDRNMKSISKKVEQLIVPASNTLNAILTKDWPLDDSILLFFKYICDTHSIHFGTRWRSESTVQSIAEWERYNLLDNVVSSNYDEIVSFLIENELVYESDWTANGNANEYTLYLSCFNCFNRRKLIEQIKGAYEDHID